MLGYDIKLMICEYVYYRLSVSDYSRMKWKHVITKQYHRDRYTFSMDGFRTNDTYS